MNYLSLFSGQFPFILFALLVTLIVETLVYFFALKKSLKFLLTIFIMNIVLNVSMNATLLLAKSEVTYYLLLLGFEILTIIIEALIIGLMFKIKFKSALSTSFLANFLSFVIGNGFYAFNIIDQEKGPSFWTLIIFSIITLLVFGLLSFLPFNKDDRKDNKRNNDGEEYETADDEEEAD